MGGNHLFRVSVLAAITLAVGSGSAGTARPVAPNGLSVSGDGPFVTTWEPHLPAPGAGPSPTPSLSPWVLASGPASGSSRSGRPTPGDGAGTAEWQRGAPGPRPGALGAPRGVGEGDGRWLRFLRTALDSGWANRQLVPVGTGSTMRPQAPATGASASSSTATYSASVSTSPSPSASPRVPRIRYYGGPVMTAPRIRVYYIFYGNSWADVGPHGAGARTILTDFMQSLGGSPWWNIMTTYYNRAGTAVSSDVVLAGAAVVAVGGVPGVGTALNYTSVRAVVTSVLAARTLPSDAGGVYFVLTSPEITEGGPGAAFCTNHCGWHSFMGSIKSVGWLCCVSFHRDICGAHMLHAPCASGLPLSCHVAKLSTPLFSAPHVPGPP
jgi:hypothetical protein